MRYAHSKWTRQPFPSAASVAGGGFALVAAVIAWAVLTETPERVRSGVSVFAQEPGTRAGIVTPSIPASRPAKLVYRYSVLPGGVRSSAELAAALRADPVAAAHFAGFNVAAARIVRVEKSRLVHVSYRIGDNIYWTKNTVRLAAGEELLTDGEHLVRARCGNRIADEPQAIMLDNEPAAEALDALMVSAGGLVSEGDEMPPGGAAMPQAGPAPGTAQPPPVRLASNVQFGARVPIPSMRAPVAGSAVAAAPPVSVSKPAFAPAATPRPGNNGPDNVFSVAPAPGSPVQLPVGPTAEAPGLPVQLPAEPGVVPPSPPPASAPAPATTIPASPAPLLPAKTAKPHPSTDLPLPFPPEPTIGPRPIAPEAPTPIPEPGSAALAAIALAAIALARRKRAAAGRRRR